MRRVLALCGGVGGAKLAFGLSQVLRVGELTIVVNPGDDFEHLGLHVAPDVDTVLYTLSGLADRERGWGLAGETWNFMAALRRLGAEAWFQLGDQDLAMHVERSRRLAAGETLSEATRELARALGVRHSVAPASDQPVRTRLVTDEGELAFQTYFVARGCAPGVRSIRYAGSDIARPSPVFEVELRRPDLTCVVLCPSNPFLSIDPILAIPGVRPLLAATPAPVVAVSPILGGEAVKGPAVKLMRELGLAPDVASVAAHYGDILDGLVIDHSDAGEAAALKARGLGCLTTGILMRTDADRVRLAEQTLSFAARLAGGARP